MALIVRFLGIGTFGSLVGGRGAEFPSRLSKSTLLDGIKLHHGRLTVSFKVQRLVLYQRGKAAMFLS